MLATARIVIIFVASFACASFAQAETAPWASPTRTPPAAQVPVAKKHRFTVRKAARTSPHHRPNHAERHRKTAHRLALSHRKRGQTGLASWYGAERHGHLTASGEPFDASEFTAAHRTLPLHSRARVTNIANGRSVTVWVTDRGPHRHDRIIDVSQAAAVELGMKRKGLAMVRVEPITTASAER